MKLTVMTFNILAPCYFRSKGMLESKFPASYLRRMKAIMHPMVHRKNRAEIICLQEYWFNEKFRNTFETKMEKFKYSVHAVQRPDEKEDGLAIFACTENITVHDVQTIGFNDVQGERVSMLMYASLRENRMADFIVVNSHLTFPHDAFNRKVRLQQIQITLKAIEEYQAANSLQHIPVVLCGDFNDALDVVHDCILEYRYESAFQLLNGREAKVTHCNHQNGEVGVDFIFTKNNSLPGFQLIPHSCYLEPRTLSDKALLYRPTFGHDWDAIDVLKIRSDEDQAKYWKFVSDHRPLVSDFKFVK